MTRAVALALALSCGCGARANLRSGEAAPAGPAPSGGACRDLPWVLFDYYDGSTARGIAALRQDGSSFHVLDLGGAHGFVPAVSPDGASLLYATGGAAGEALVLMDLATHATRVVTQLPPNATGHLSRGAVSPDNAFLAWGESLSVMVSGFDGSNARVLVPGPFEAGCCSWGWGHPAFAGDSITVLVSTIGRLESIHVDGSGRQLLEQDQIFGGGNNPGFVFPNPSFAPDHQRFVAEVACATSELRVFPVDALPGDPCGAGAKIADAHPSDASNESSNPAWGPGALIAYEDGPDIWLVDANGGTPKNLTAALTKSPGAAAVNPAWAPGCANLP